MRSAVTPWWRNRRLLPWLLQAAVGLVVLVLVAFLLGNLVRNLTNAGLLLTWSWLGNPSGFEISETAIPFDASMPYWRALLAGLVLTSFDALIPAALAFAGGVMVFITLDELIPVAREHGHQHYTAIGIILGAVFVFILSGVLGV